MLSWTENLKSVKTQLELGVHEDNTKPRRPKVPNAPLEGVGRITCCTIGFATLVGLVSCCNICFEVVVDVRGGKGNCIDLGDSSINALVAIARWTDGQINYCKTNCDAPLKGVGRIYCCVIGFDAVVYLVSLIGCCCTICFEALVDVASGGSICPDR